MYALRDLARTRPIGQSAWVGYNLHITRADDWTESVDAPIEYAEWMEHAASDTRLVEAGTISLKDIEPAEQPVYVFSDGPSIHWWRGELVVSGAGESDVESLCTVADALGARLQGDDGEFYA